MTDWENITDPDHDADTFVDAFRSGAITNLSHGGAIPPSQLPSLPIGTTIGDYDVDHRIGEGAMSEVYLAVHRAIGRRVAIKLLSPRLFADPEAIERFNSEARAAAEIHHPNIVHVFGFGHLADRAYIIMEWLRGENLGVRLARGAVPFTDALDIILQTTSALRAAHDHDIIHRDLKPENVFLQDIKDEKPVVKVLDFGLAKRGRGGRSLTLEGQLLGTPLYMSPEQCRGKDVDHRTDIYALGCLWYQLITGRPPFDMDSVAELVMAHLTAMPEPPRDVCRELPDSVDVLVRGMLAKDPRQRPVLSEVRRCVQRLLGVHTAPMPAVELTADEPASSWLVSTARECPSASHSPEVAKRDGKPLTREGSQTHDGFAELESDTGDTFRLPTRDSPPSRRRLDERSTVDGKPLTRISRPALSKPMIEESAPSPAIIAFAVTTIVLAIAAIIAWLVVT